MDRFAALIPGIVQQTQAGRTLVRLNFVYILLQVYVVFILQVNNNTLSAAAEYV